MIQSDQSVAELIEVLQAKLEMDSLSTQYTR